jgi:Icc-related predicted phosphoesterase
VSLFSRRRRDGGQDGEWIELYYASDVHGSDRCWRKFLGAGRFYGLEHLVMGGDLVGKAVVPIERRPDGTHACRFLGDVRVAANDDELAEIVDAIRFNGMYPWIATADEVGRYSGDATGQGELFDRVVRDDLARWLDLARERLQGNGAHLYVIAGNDDPWYVDDLLAGAEAVEFCDERVVRVGEHEMISCSYANPTPWNSPRELDEDALYERLKALADQLEAPERAIFNLHVPPYDSGLDTATELKADLTPRYSGGQPVHVPVGSRAVRQVIEEYQPLLALHGHIHESRGEAQIGRTLALNSGSEYNTGRLHGVIVKLGTERVISHQFVVG